MKRALKRILVSVLVSTMLITMIPTMGVKAETNPYPINGINGSTGAYSNCTWTVWQLVYENLGIVLPAWRAAGYWYDDANASGYSVSSTIPMVNSIKVTSGHVAFVTAVSADGKQVYVKEGGYGTGSNLGYHEGWVSAYPSDLKGYIYLQKSFGFDCPVDNQVINEETFQFSGWVDADKSISSITCSINDGASYVSTLLYTREDVPNAVAFRADVKSTNLNYGRNKISLCVNYQDGTAETLAYKYVDCARVVRQYGFDSPENNAVISGDSFLFYGWMTASKTISSITCSVNDGENYIETRLYTREDVPDATAFRVEISANKLKIGTNKISVCANYSDGTAETVTYKHVIRVKTEHIHNLSEVEGQEALCEANGVKVHWICSGCSQLFADAEGSVLIENSDELIITAKGHNGGSATCTKKAICETCYEEYGELNPVNHGENEIKNQKVATCGEDGYTGDSYCVDCEEVITYGEVIPKHDTHTWDEGTVTKEPTYTENGIKTYICEVCNSEKTEEIDKLVKPEHTHSGGKATCTKKAICETCNEKYGELNPSNHGTNGTKNQKAATCGEDGYTGDIYCVDCEEIITYGEVIPKHDTHTWDAGIITKEPTYTEKGIKQFTCKICYSTRNEFLAMLEKPKAPENGTIIVDTYSQGIYKITNSDTTYGTVEYVGTSNKSITSVMIPKTIEIQGITYKVTSIGSKALYNCGSIKKLSISENIVKIGKQAFKGCKKLKSIIIRSNKLTNKKIENQAFSGINKKAVIKVPKKKQKAYTKMLRKKGIGSKVKIKKNLER